MNPRRLDAHTWAIFLEVPGSKIVSLQALFETYEGLGTLRTIDAQNSLVCVLTTDSLLTDCKQALDSIRNMIPWRLAEESALVGKGDEIFGKYNQ